MWNANTFPSDSNTHQVSFPLKPPTNPQGGSSLSPQTTMLLLEQLIQNEMPSFILHQANSLFLNVLLKYYFSKAVLHQDLVTPSSFPHFPTLNTYQLLITIWFALDKHLPPSSLRQRPGGITVSPPIGDY